MLRIIHIISFFLIGTMGYSQMNLVFLDSSDDTPIPYLMVEIIGKSKGVVDTFQTLTDAKGALEVPQEFKVLRIIISNNFYEYYDELYSLETKTIQLKPSFKKLGQFVVTGQYSGSTIDNSVHQIKVIDQERIKAQGAVSLRDVLSNETNIRITQDGILGSGMSIQGVSGENVKIMIDGVPVIGRLDGSIDLSQINLDNVERIEIVEGPLSVSYGTDALGGTINLISKKQKKNSKNIRVATYYESVGQYNTNLNLGIGKNKHSFNISLGRNYFDGWSAADSYTLLPMSYLADNQRVKAWNPKEQLLSNAKYTFQNKNLALTIYGDWFNEEIENRGAPRLPYKESAFDDVFTTNRFNKGVQWKYTLSENSAFEGVAAHNGYGRVKNTFVKDLTNLETQLSENILNHDTATYSLLMSRGTFSHKSDSSKLNYQIGYDLNFDKAAGRRIESGIQEYSDIAVFGSMEYSPIKDLVIKPGIRLINNSRYKAPVVPSFNLKWKVKNTVFRASFAKGFRAPSLKELYFEFVDVNHNIIGNENLTAETSNNFQINASYKKIMDKVILKLEARSFYNQVQNQINLALTPGENEYSYLNIDEFRSKGIGANLSLSFEQLSIRFSSVLNGILYDLNKEGQQLFDSFTYSPEIAGQISYSFEKSKFKINLFYKYNGFISSFYLDESNEIQEFTSDAYGLLDITLSKTFWKSKLQITSGVKNLLGVTNIYSTRSSSAHSGSSNQQLTAWGRSFFIGLNFNISKS
ncbi:MAG: outer membrane receptor for ferrienterochelin and colicins [Parvicella sp.]|jgi:outer membrane receptor for ferrienterochelin and colicins